MNAHNSFKGKKEPRGSRKYSQIHHVLSTGAQSPPGVSLTETSLDSRVLSRPKDKSPHKIPPPLFQREDPRNAISNFTWSSATG